MDSHQILDAPTAIAILESREGGRWYERADDGSECDWGYVREIDRPTRILLAWHLTLGVEVRSRSREDDARDVPARRLVGESANLARPRSRR